jgi:hypothetical protein
MLKLRKVAVLPMILSVLAAAAGAQGSAQECNVDENTTVSMSVFALMAAQQPGTAPAEVRKQLATAIGRMFPDDASAERDNKRNPVGRAFVLGKIYMMYLSQEGQPVVTTRGALGFKTRPNDPADLSIGIDSAFKIVEEKDPQCAYTTSQWRQQAGWVKLVQSAMDYANDQSADSAVHKAKIDSAEMVAQRALRISPTAPYSHLVLGNVAAARQQNMDAIKHYKDALEEAGKDTIFSEVRRTILYTLGNFANDAAANDTSAKNRALYSEEARTACDALSKDPGKQYAALRASGDTTAIKNACKDQVANPASFEFLALVQCGVTLADVKDYSNATKLLEAATAQNPYHRDGLFNLALMQISSGEQLQARADSLNAGPVAKRDSVSILQAAAIKQFEASIQTTDRLVAVDPSNPDDYKLYVHSYNGIRKYQLARAKAFGDTVNGLASSKKAADQAHRKALIDSAAKMDPLQHASLNKLIELNTKADSMPVKVSFTEFTPGASKTTLSGEIANRTDKEQSYTLTVEFVDKTGQVVGTSTASVPNVRPRGRGTFAVTGTAPGIVAFRYKPIA